MTDTSNPPTAAEPPQALTADLLREWIKPDGPVALCLTQKLLPVQAVVHKPEDGAVGPERGLGVIYPPTYAEIGYNIDSLPDGTLVALIDSVGSQANRMEPVFKRTFGEKSEYLVPQIKIKLKKEDRWLLDLAHRAADAVVQCCPTLKEPFTAAFMALQKGNAWPLCVLAPTSLVFGVWDSRGGSGEKRPRLVRSVIRAWDVAKLHSAAQYNSVWKALDKEERRRLEEEEAKEGRKELADVGFQDAPAVTRKDGGRVLGGVFVKGCIEREVTVNLVALRNLCGEPEDKADKTTLIHEYLLALSLIAATEPPEPFLREGCLLQCPNTEERWRVVPRCGPPRYVDLGPKHPVLEKFALETAAHFRPYWKLQDADHQFDLNEALGLLDEKKPKKPAKAKPKKKG